jgi:hypothetical protein
MLVAVVGLLLLGAVACGGGDDEVTGQGLHRTGTYHENCPRCGMQWTVTVDEFSEGPDTVEVSIRNTGERGELQLLFDKVIGVALNAQQAEAWQSIYPQARAERNAFGRLAPLQVRQVNMTFASGPQPPVTLRSGSSWTGRYNLTTDIPAGTAAVIFSFGDVRHETTPAGLAEVDAWLTWDLNRPFIGLDGEVRVTPIASPLPAP